jgi:hypothetical protein
MTRHQRALIGLLAVIAALVVAPAAHAQGTPTAADDQYGAVLGEQSGSGNVAGAGGLPFTGLDLLIVGGVGSALTAAGLAVRRLGRV